MTWAGQPSEVAVSQCHYCEVGLRTAQARFVVVNRKAVAVHRRTGEVSA
ncbi:hypothetical protein [Kitasatospora sp. McL0602]